VVGVLVEIEPCNNKTRLTHDVYSGQGKCIFTIVLLGFETSVDVMR